MEERKKKTILILTDDEKWSIGPRPRTYLSEILANFLKKE
jgi:hypothetical protein